MAPAQPLRQIVSDLRSSQADDLETSYIAAQDAARDFQQGVTAILSTYNFSRYEFGTLYNAGGDCTQAAMQVVSPIDVNDRCLVIGKDVDGEAEYSAYCPPFQSHKGPTMIAAVKARVEKNRAKRLRTAQAA